MSNPADDTQSVMAALGLAGSEEEASAVAVVTGTIDVASADVAMVKVRAVGAKPYEAIMPVTEFPANKRWAQGETYQLLQLGSGNRPVVSATRPELVEALFDGVSPEVRAGQVRIMGVARAAGVRSKVAVAATEPGVDPVASLVGRGANRVKAVAVSLGGERIDVVAWHPDRETFLRNALAPAAVSEIHIDEDAREATAAAPAHQMSAAVGGGGLNSALAGQLVGLRVTIVPE
jgi:N utilization substance protein A